MEDISNRGDLSWGGLGGEVANTQKFFTQKFGGGLSFYAQEIFYAQQDFINTIYQTIYVIAEYPLGCSIRTTPPPGINGYNFQVS